MENSLQNLEYCSSIVSEMKNLLLFTHLPSMGMALLLGFIVYARNKNSLLAKILLGLSLSFAIWASLNLIIWLKFDDARYVMAAWAPIEAMKVLIFFLCWYFSYSFVTGRDFSVFQKCAWAILFLVIFGLSVTTANLVSYNLAECISIENTLFSNLTYLSEIFILALTSLFLTVTYFKTKIPDQKRRILFMGTGIVVFIVSFFVFGLVSENTFDYSYEAYGLFGMVIFISSLAYLIYRYSVFNIKILGTQLLVIALIVLTASQLTFTSGYTAVLALVTTLLSALFGYFLIKSVKTEIAQRKRVEELAHQLEVTNEKLKSLDKLKTEFLSLASHQLRSPLTAIKGYSSLLIEGSFGELQGKQSEGVKRIYSSAQGLVNIVEDLLNVSKIEQGGMKYEMMPTELAPLVTALYNEMKIPAESKGLAFTLDIPGGDAFTALVDPLKLKQVFLNLTDNSIKYTPSGFVKLSLARKDNKIVFAVTDSGVGVTSETKEKLFQKFSRGEGGKLNTGGSGLGLYLAQEITKAHKGQIIIESEGADKGASFIVELPAQA